MTNHTRSPRTVVCRPEVFKDICVLCTHIFEGGHRCASPELRRQTHCYYHQPGRLAHHESRDVRRAAERLHRRTFPTPSNSQNKRVRSPKAYALP